uniref:peptidylprolyl isomerase n=1 Tax=Callorhinchus milii TaxID=7868 RepID=A0A4W3H448_CALMI|eukprot:gi/632962013/ref/XP_007897075.1/ PREDICTED: peptidyl-prolyl cis-trans isomerase FKBP8 [Callorhinchus milii]
MASVEETQEIPFDSQWGAGDGTQQVTENEHTDTLTSDKTSSRGKASLLDSGEDTEISKEDTDEDDPNDLPPLEDVGSAITFQDCKDEKFESEESSDTKVQRVEESEGADSGPVTADDGEKPEGEWLEVLGNGLLKKKVLVAGRGELYQPQKGQNVTIRLKTSLEDGTVLQEEPGLSFTLGDGDVIQALDLCVQLMELDETAQIISDSKYAYGTRGSTQPAIPPSARLHMEVQLVDVEEAPDPELLSGRERLDLANSKRERGNAYYQRADFVSATNSYSIALNIVGCNSKVDITVEEESELLDVKVKCLNNLAATQLKLEHYESVLKSCSAVLQHQPDNIKALFRKGKVLALQREYTEAIAVLRKALKLEPSNKMLHTELSKLVKKHSEQKNIEQAMYKKMLGDIATSSPSGPPSKSPWSIPWKWLFGASMVAVGGVAVSIIVAARN